MSSRVEYAPISSPGPRDSAVASAPVPVTTAVAYSCAVGAETVNSLAFVPGKATDLKHVDVAAYVHHHARREANAPHSTPVVCSHIKPLHDNTRSDEASHDHYMASRMAPSCKKYNYDLNEVTSYNRYTCRYLGTGTVTDAHGKTQLVTSNPFKEYRGILPSCDHFDMESGLEIKDDTMSAIRRHAFEQAGGSSAGLQEDRFMCEVMSLPLY